MPVEIVETADTTIRAKLIATLHDSMTNPSSVQIKIVLGGNGVLVPADLVTGVGSRGTVRVTEVAADGGADHASVRAQKVTGTGEPDRRSRMTWYPLPLETARVLIGLAVGSL